MRDPVIEATQKKFIAASLSSKARELEYFLEHMKQAGTGSQNLFVSQTMPTEEVRPEDEEMALQYHRGVMFGCSAFLNAVFSLRDAVDAVTGVRLTPAEMHSCRHGEFLFQLRNASTHDGMPVTDAWVEGKLYFLAPRSRYGQGTKTAVVTLTPPNIDIVSASAEFAKDWCTLLVTKLSTCLERPELCGAYLTPEWLDEAWSRTDILPAFAVAEYQKQRTAVHAYLLADRTDPVAKAIEELTRIAQANSGPALPL